MSVIVVKDQAGQVIREGRVPTEPHALQPFFAEAGPLTIALEATTTSRWLYDTLEARGHTVHLAPPLKVRAIASARIKPDRIDAGILCDLLRGQLLPTSYVPPPVIRDLREVLRHRIRLVQGRTHVKHRLTPLLAKTNQTVPGTTPFGVKARAVFAQLPLPPMLAWQREDGLGQRTLLNRQSDRIDRQLHTIAGDHPEVPRLTALPGIGIFSALLLLAEIGEVRRFPSANQLVGYAGLAPGLYQRGDTRHGRGITRQGSRSLRWILVEASPQVIRQPGPLRHTCLRLTEGKGHGTALGAVARQLLVGVYAVLPDGQTFGPHASGVPSSGARSGDSVLDLLV